MEILRDEENICVNFSLGKREGGSAHFSAVLCGVNLVKWMVGELVWARSEIDG